MVSGQWSVTRNQSSEVSDQWDLPGVWDEELIEHKPALSGVTTIAVTLLLTGGKDAKRIAVELGASSFWGDLAHTTYVMNALKV